MQNEYIKLIAELDKTIAMIRTYWMDARDNSEKKKWRIRLDELLDERFRLMQARDSKNSA